MNIFVIVINMLKKVKFTHDLHNSPTKMEVSKLKHSAQKWYFEYALCLHTSITINKILS